MPIVYAKRKREVEEQLVQKTKRFKLTHHAMFDKIGYLGDHHHSLYREIPLIGVDFEKILRREVGSFLNGNGGIVAFGVRTNGTILGNKLTRKEEDNFKLAVDRILIGFHPIVKPTMYRLIIEPVYDKYTSWVNNLFLIQLKVNKGEQYCLYEDGEHEVYVRSGSSFKGPLTAREIKERVTAEYEQRRREIRRTTVAAAVKPVLKNTDVLMQDKDSKKEMEMKATTKHTTVTVKPAPKNTIVRKGKEESKKETDLKTTTKDKASSSTATTTITVKVVPKTAKIVKEGKEVGTKAVTKTSNSSIVKIHKPLATKN